AAGGATHGSTATVTFASGSTATMPVTYPSGASHGSLDVTLPGTDATSSITISGGFTLNTTIAPVLVAGRTYRYTVDGTVNAADQLISIDDPLYVDVTIPTSQNGFVVDAGSVTDLGRE